MTLTTQTNKQYQTKPICIRNGEVLLETTLRCYSNCPYCYKAGLANPSAKHVPIQTIQKRIDWIKQYTNADTVNLIGGEPLTHPEFKSIAKYIMEQDLELSIFSCANPGLKKDNLDHLVELYSSGSLCAVNLSYHQNRNETKLLRLVNQLESEYENRQKNLTAMIADSQKSKDSEKTGRLRVRQKKNLSIYATFPKISEQEFSKGFQFILETLCRIDLKNSQFSDKQHKTIQGPQFTQIEYQLFLQAFRPFKDSQQYLTPINFGDANSFKKLVVIKNAICIEQQNKNTLIKTAKGGACPAMSSRILNDEEISVSEIVIRSDGEITFQIPSCISAKRQLGNVNELNDPLMVYESVKKGVHKIRRIIIDTKTTEVKGKNQGNRFLCLADRNFSDEPLDNTNYVCSCNTDLACNICVNS